MKQDLCNKAPSDQVYSHITQSSLGTDNGVVYDGSDNDDSDGLNDSLSTVSSNNSSESDDSSLEDDEATSPVVRRDTPRQHRRLLKKRRILDTTPRSKRCVHFSVVQVQEYAVTFGDHPCPDRFPISLDWEHSSVQEMDLYEFEERRRQRKRACTRRKRGNGRPSPLSAAERCVKLSLVGGLAPAELTKREQERQEQLEKELLDSYQCDDDSDDEDGSDDDDEGEECVSQPAPYQGTNNTGDGVSRHSLDLEGDEASDSEEASVSSDEDDDIDVGMLFRSLQRTKNALFEYRNDQVEVVGSG